jgi:Leucine-rich repeat (LRR) protein
MEELKIINVNTKLTGAIAMVVSDAIRLSKLECLRYIAKNEFVPDIVVDALRSNRHLETFVIDECLTLGDATLCRIVEAAMDDNPSLKELDLVMYGNLTLQAIANCLAEHGNKLSALTMWHPRSEAPEWHQRNVAEEPADTPNNAIDFTLLLDALQNENCLLRKLRICFYYHQAEVLLPDILWSCPTTLEILDLSCNRLSSFNIEQTNTFATSPDTSLKELLLGDNELEEVEPVFQILSKSPKLQLLELDIFENSNGDSDLEGMALAIFRDNPLLHTLGQAFSTKVYRNQEINHLMDMNWAGRVLFGHSEVPLSLWPIVMERVNKYSKFTTAREANSIYGLLCGSPIVTGL